MREQAARSTETLDNSGALPGVPVFHYVLFSAIAATGGIADLWSKYIIFSWPPGPGRHNEWWIFENFFGIQTAWNRGALFGLGQGYFWLFALLSIIAAIGIIGWLFVLKAGHDQLLTISLACVMAGIIGNLYDRLVYRAVRDWILVCYYDHIWPNFNIADSFLVCGAALLALQAIFPRDESCLNSPK